MANNSISNPILYFETEAYDLFAKIIAAVCQVQSPRDNAQVAVFEATPSRITVRAADPSKTLQVAAAIPAKMPQSALCRPQDPSQVLAREDAGQILIAYRGEWRTASRGFGINITALHASLMGLSRDLLDIGDLLQRRLTVSYGQGSEQLRLLLTRGTTECAIGLPLLTIDSYAEISLAEEQALAVNVKPKAFLQAIEPVLGKGGSVSFGVLRSGEALGLFISTTTSSGMSIRVEMGLLDTWAEGEMRMLGEFEFKYQSQATMAVFRILKIADACKVSIDKFGRLSVVVRLKDSHGIGFVEYRLLPIEL